MCQCRKSIDWLAVKQNADLVLAVGNRLSIRQVGYNWKTWAREAYVIDVDVDPAELKKTTIHVDMPVCGDAKDFFEKMAAALEGAKSPVFEGKDWVERCQNWKKDYPVTLPKHWEEDGKYANVYAFINYLSISLRTFACLFCRLKSSILRAVPR